MPRKLRAEYPGAVYHVMSRGDGCEAIFLEDVDRQDCLKSLAEGCQKTGWRCGNPPAPPMNRAESGLGYGLTPFRELIEAGLRSIVGLCVVRWLADIIWIPRA